MENLFLNKRKERKNNLSGLTYWLNSAAVLKTTRDQCLYGVRLIVPGMFVSCTHDIGENIEW